MEILLLAITVVSLIVAFIMSAAAWRLSRQARAHGSARVAALAAAANEPDGPAANAPRTIAVAEAIADPVAVNEPRSAPWSPARVSSFAAPRNSATPTVSSARSEALGDKLDLVMRQSADPQPARSAAFSDSFLGSAVSTPPSGGRQRGLAIAAVLLFVAAIAGGYWTVFGDRSATATAPAVSDAAPLELVSLRHERRGPRLSVTGLVRNPAAGTPVNELTAVVFLFDQQGGFITSARAGVDFLKLAPGDETPFVIAVDAPNSVARYRVSFRNEAGIVPHVDRRGQEPVVANSVRE
jgi:hypothetical protein